jgi:hypothetical protein
LIRRPPVLILLAVSWSIATAAETSADAALAQHEIVYKGTASGAPIRVKMELKPSAENGWVYRSKTGTRGWLAWKGGEIREESEFAIENGEIVSRRYRKSDTFSKKDRNIDSRFSRGGVESTYRGEEIAHEYDELAYDLLNLRLALMRDLTLDRLRNEYRIVDGKGRTRVLAVRLEGQERIELRGGSLDAIKLSYDDDDKRFLIWIDPVMDCQIVLIEQYEDGKLKARLTWDQYMALQQGASPDELRPRPRCGSADG